MLWFKITMTRVVATIANGCKSLQIAILHIDLLGLNYFWNRVERQPAKLAVDDTGVVLN